MERWGIRESLCAVELFIRKVSITEFSADFAVNGINRKPHPKCNPSMGKAVA